MLRFESRAICIRQLSANFQMVHAHTEKVRAGVAFRLLSVSGFHTHQFATGD